MCPKFFCMRVISIYMSSIIKKYLFCRKKKEKKDHIPICTQSRTDVQLFATPWTVACQAPLSMGSSLQEYWSGLPIPLPGDISNPGIAPSSPVSLALQADTFNTEPHTVTCINIKRLHNMDGSLFKMVWLRIFQLYIDVNVAFKRNQDSWEPFGQQGDPISQS